MKMKSANPEHQMRRFSQETIRSRFLVPTWLPPLLLTFWILGLILASPVRAVIPEPDNIVFGLIAIETNLVTAQNTNFTVEVQRAAGEVVYRYRIGENPDFGNHYVVEIPLEAGASLRPGASTNGSPLQIVVKETLIVGQQTFTQEHYRTNFVVADRGYVERVDFGQITVTLTGFDAWAQAWGIDPDNVDLDGDRMSNYDEYLAGTNPLDPNSKFMLAISHTPTGAELSVEGLLAEGPGYESHLRLYSVETTTNSLSGSWTDLTGFVGIPGNDEVIIIPVQTTNALPKFYRGKVHLFGPF